MTDTSLIVVPAGLPRIGDPAPDLDADSTHGRVRLADYAGRWLVLFSHPADFTPVCTTEFVAFAELADDFAARNTALLGNSIDSVYSHLAWARAIADLDMKVPAPTACFSRTPRRPPPYGRFSSSTRSRPSGPCCVTR